ncbi:MULTISPECIES: hypothetical protein [Pseudomonadaceae]|jgi:hypothetical protein|uniref:Crocagin biosynthetic protein CgnE/B domain-containing protein n=1 Tax=Ectopseudomonas oleovorans TaxID=301 RepID=A0A653B033_ECTOL|nr:MULTISPECIES: hypothetical protein [Pseudomonas]UZZ09865.1 hypothetical protein NDO41_21060 [Pseudomonas mendocina]WJH58403.1 hypothetical protein FE254_20575 [Pseudomonas guguanensis]CAE6947871.1 conserved protein of unknown function [Pseudomonas oleovorans]
MSNLGQLRCLFDTDDIVVVGDNSEFLRAVSERGISGADIRTMEAFPDTVVSISFSDDAARRTFVLASQNPNTKMIFCAAHVFDDSIESAIYSLDLMRKSNFKAALAKQKGVISFLETTQDIQLSGNGADCTVTLDGTTKPFALRKDINSPYVASVAEFFEVHFAHIKKNEPCPFHISGELQIAGALSVLRPTGKDPYQGSRDDVSNFLKEIAAAKTVNLVADNNEIVSFKIENRECVDFVRKIGGERGSQLTEFAVGVNQSISDEIDYRVNSQINEGIEGIHVAIGDAVTGYHIDLLCPGVQINNASR